MANTVMSDFLNVNIFNPINGKLPYFVDAFCKVYGEKYRQQIEHNLNNSCFLFVGGDVDYIQEKLMESHKNEFSKNSIKHFTLLREELAKITGTKQERELKEKMLYAEAFKKQKEERQEIIEKYGKCFEHIRAYNKKVKELEQQYNEIIINYLKQRIKEICSINNVVRNDAELTRFAKIYSQILEMGRDKFYKNRKNISKYFKANLGMHLFFEYLGYTGKTVEEFLKNNPSLIKDLFNKDTVKYVQMAKNRKNNDILKNNLFLNYGLAKIKEQNLYDETMFYVYLLNYINQKTPAETAFVVRSLNKQKNLMGVCFFGFNENNTLKVLVHEMGHIVDQSFKKIDDNTFLVKSGFNYRIHVTNERTRTTKIYNHLNTEIDTLTFYKAFNEIFNEYLSLKVTERLTEMNVDIPVATIKEKGFCTYGYVFTVFRDFFDKHMDALIACKMSENPLAFEKYFGEENAYILAKTANDYMEELDKCLKTTTPYQGIVKLNNLYKPKIYYISSLIEEEKLQQKNEVGTEIEK